MTDSDLRLYVSGRMHELTSIRTEDEAFTVSKETVDHLRQILNLVCDADIVFPTIVPDGENGIEASWIAQQYMVRINVDSDSDAWVTLIRPQEPHHINPFDGTNTEDIRRCLNELSDYVKSHNPQWRTLFRR